MANILSSLGNILKNPSFLAQAAAAFGTGGTSALPAIFGRGALAGGMDFLGQQRQDKLNENIQRAQAAANFRSNFGSAGPSQPVVDIPKAGFLEKLGGAAQTGIAAHDAFRMAQQGFQAAQEALGDRQIARDRLLGQDEALALGPSPQVPASQIGGGPGTVQGNIPFDNQFASTSAPGSRQDLSFRAAQQERQAQTVQQEILNEFARTRLGQTDKSLSTQAFNAQTSRGGLTLRRQERLDDLGRNATKRGAELEGHFRNAIGPSFFADPTQNFETYMANADSMGLDLNRAKQIFDEETSALQTQLADKSTAFLHDKMRLRIKDDKLVNNAGNLRFAMSTIASGFNQDNGFGDVNMMIGTVRLSDPAVSVRAEDVHTLEEALAWLERADPELIKGMAIKGDRLLPEARERLLRSALDLYDTNRLGIDITLGGLVQEAQASIPDAAPGRINTFMNTFKLPDAQVYILKPKSPFGAFMALKILAERRGQ